MCVCVCAGACKFRFKKGRLAASQYPHVVTPGQSVL